MLVAADEAFLGIDEMGVEERSLSRVLLMARFVDIDRVLLLTLLLGVAVRDLLMDAGR